MVVPDASLVIVNYRTPEMTHRCLSLAADAADGLSLESVVVDNASGDGSVALLSERHPDATIISAPKNRGFAAGVNAGFAATSAPFVLVLNPDTEPHPGSFRRLIEHLHRSDRTGVAAPILHHPGGALQRNAHRRFPNLLTLFVDFCVPVGYLLALMPDLHPHELSVGATARGPAVAHVNGAALAIRRSAYEAAGGLDEGFFMYMEETEWQQRVRRAGWEIEVVPEAHVTHVTRAGAAMPEITDRYLPSVYRYMAMQGHGELIVSLVLAAATALSRLTLAAIACLFQSKRESTLELLAFHRSVAYYIRARRRR